MSMEGSSIHDRQGHKQEKRFGMEMNGFHEARKRSRWQCYSKCCFASPRWKFPKMTAACRMRMRSCSHVMEMGHKNDFQKCKNTVGHFRKNGRMNSLWCCDWGVNGKTIEGISKAVLQFFMESSYILRNQDRANNASIARIDTVFVSKFWVVICRFEDSFGTYNFKCVNSYRYKFPEVNWELNIRSWRESTHIATCWQPGWGENGESQY